MLRYPILYVVHVPYYLCMAVGSVDQQWAFWHTLLTVCSVDCWAIISMATFVSFCMLFKWN